MLVNICMVTHNRLELTRRSIESVLELTRLNNADFLLQVVDNGSSDGSQNYLKELASRYSRLKIFLLNRNMGVAVAANLGWGLVDSDYYLKLDNDIIIRDPHWLQSLLDLARRNPELGQVGHLYGTWPYPLQTKTLASGDSILSSSMCNGGCCLIPRAVHERLGFWNEDYGQYGFEDLDYSERCSLAGYEPGYAHGQGFVEHLGFAPASRDEALEALKKNSVRSGGKAEKLFVLNRFMFKEGLRELYVKRKYLPTIEGGTVSFRTNPEYKALSLFQADLLDLVNYEYAEDGIKLDVASLAKLKDRLAG